MDSTTKDNEDRAQAAQIFTHTSEQDGTQMMHVSDESAVTTLESIWSASQDADDVAFRPRNGWWSLHDWATASWLLVKDGTPVGVAAIRYTPDDDKAEARLALLPAFRQTSLALLLVKQVRSVAQTQHKARLILATSATADWVKSTIQQQNFSLLRTGHMMSRPISATPLPFSEIEGIHVRSLRTGEEPQLLETLNRAWANTWNFHPITMEALLDDLKDNYDSFFVAVDQTDDTRMLGTVHVLFDRSSDESDPWISNLTVDPSQRGKGLGRMLLTVALNYLSKQGASSVTLGVDGGAVAPVTLYRSIGFEAIRTLEVWEQDIATPQQ
ncbi:hypothetical protein KDW_49980 [Dictyobacter vulcani]|uniref:N-acetyltransferase domain-containing protein n=1 Tax=Dictyobacter vulcani TaxID=2607529 RepID=A0A5J4L034_9CHLR|nr:GNAT family N-acetyltransferase [Dictyobacter vulcani]GER90836.1 hypothetical protein KDW_49980 [Dictyobacter vulcani]